MKKLLTILTLFVTLSAHAGFWRALYGDKPHDAIDVGAGVVHMHPSANYDYFYPMVGVTVYSANFMYFKNSFHKSTYGITMERQWTERRLGSSNFTFNLNYRAGILAGGYCIHSLSCAKKSLPLIPIVQVIGSLAYKNKIATSITWLGTVITASLQYRFS